MGILFNVLVIGPLRRGFDGLDARWRCRKDAGEAVCPLKPSGVFLLGLTLAVVAIGVLA